MSEYKCPKCGRDAPECGGEYQKQYSAEENGLRWFWFPTYMCEDDDCQMEFVFTGYRIVKGKNVWQDSNVKREDWDECDEWK